MMPAGSGRIGAPTGSNATSAVLRFGTGVGLINEERVGAPCGYFPAGLMPFFILLLKTAAYRVFCSSGECFRKGF